MNSLLEDSIIDIINNYNKFFLYKKNVTGLGLGLKTINGINTLEPCLHVFVEKKLPLSNLYNHDIIPKTFFSIKTDVIESETFKSYSQNNTKNLSELNIPIVKPTKNKLTFKVYPIRAGYSIAPENVFSAGTIGAIVFGNDDNTAYILSNNHVLFNINKLPVGTSIIQPSRIDNIGKEIAKLTKCVKLISYTGDYTVNDVNYVDCAIAKINSDLAYSTDIDFIGKIKGTAFPNLNKEVIKVGRTTNVTTGTITAIFSTHNVNFPNGKKYRFRDLIITTPMSEAGDSGALVLEKHTQKAIGLIIGGNDKFSCICLIQHVLKNLNIHF